MSTVIYHNPKCGTSRKVLAAIRASGTEPTVVAYLATGWTRAQLQGLFAAANLTPQQALRKRGTDAVAHGLPDADDDTVLDAMIADPILVERPFVCTPRGTALCRPAEVVLPLLELQQNGGLS